MQLKIIMHESLFINHAVAYSTQLQQLLVQTII